MSEFECNCGGKLFIQITELTTYGEMSLYPKMFECKRCSTLYRSAFDPTAGEFVWRKHFENEEKKLLEPKEEEELGRLSGLMEHGCSKDESD